MARALFLLLLVCVENLREQDQIYCTASYGDSRCSPLLSIGSEPASALAYGVSAGSCLASPMQTTTDTQFKPGLWSSGVPFFLCYSLITSAAHRDLSSTTLVFLVYPAWHWNMVEAAAPYLYDDEEEGRRLAGAEGTEFQANTFTSGDQKYPDVAGLADGGFVITWQSDGQDGDNKGIYGQIYDVSGVRSGLEFRINSHTTGAQVIAVVEGLADGGFVAGWDSHAQDTDNWGIYAQRFAANGATAGGEFKVNTHITSEQRYADIAALTDEGFIIVWTSYAQDGSGWGVYCQRYASDGTTSGPEFRANSYTTSEQNQPSVSALPNGAFVVTWVSNEQDTYLDGVYAQRFTSTNAKVGGEFRVNSAVTGYQSQPTVTTLSSGDFIIVWQGEFVDSSFPNVNYGIIGQQYSSTGVASGGNFRVSTYTPNNQWQPKISALKDGGGFVAVWRSDGQDGSGKSVQGQRFNSDHSLNGTEFQGNTYSTSIQDEPAVSGLVNGGFVIAWQSDGQDGGGYGIYGQRFNTHGMTLGPPTFAPTGMPSSRPTRPLECGVNGVLHLSELTGTNGFVINGEATSNEFGFSVSAAGDVNGDGVADVIVGARHASPTGAESGASYVIFGGSGVGSGGTVAASALDGTNGFQISGVSGGDKSGWSVSSAGDVNGDGYDDVIVGSPYVATSGPTVAAGAGYVIFGASTFPASGTVLLSSLDGSDGFKLVGPGVYDYAGTSVSTAGDINNDGYGDVIIGAPNANPNGGTAKGEAYVVFGHASVGSSGTVTIASLDGIIGFKIEGIAEHDACGHSVSAAGDVNGDGYADIIIGAPNADEGGSLSGTTYVIFGASSVGSGGTFAVSSIDGSNGFKITGAAAGDESGASVSGAGDFDGDGFNDIIIGASSAAPNGAESGTAYILFGGSSIGHTGTLSLNNLDLNSSVQLTGSVAGDHVGRSVSFAGDINNDGLSDVVVGAVTESGSSYVLFGGSGMRGTTIELSILDGSNGFELTGVASGDNSGMSVSYAGDVNSDGVDDFIIGAPNVGTNGASSGAAYVVLCTSQLLSPPSGQPTYLPSEQPSSRPTGSPSSGPSSAPSRMPSGRPTRTPSSHPTGVPTSVPSGIPTGLPSTCPTGGPTSGPSIRPSATPTRHPTSGPSTPPSSPPSNVPSGKPSRSPTALPSSRPTSSPTSFPSGPPSGQPSVQPTCQPSCSPSSRPTSGPSGAPTVSPTALPSSLPSSKPTSLPSGGPTSQPSSTPSAQPSGRPSGQPSAQPTLQPSSRPTSEPSGRPTCHPSGLPTTPPSGLPTAQPSTQPSLRPSGQPTTIPSAQPSGQPSAQPSGQPSGQPTGEPSTQPSARPTAKPTGQPSGQPSGQPTSQPSGQPSGQPTVQPTVHPTSEPSGQPSGQPTGDPSGQPSGQPTGEPSTQPSTHPTAKPSAEPSAHPTTEPTSDPSAEPSGQPSELPTGQPSGQPSEQPSTQPSAQPTSEPSEQPSGQPSSRPSDQPSGEPTSNPSGEPSSQPSAEPSALPSGEPSGAPSTWPSSMPSGLPSSQPTSHPSSEPTVMPSTEPSAKPSASPSSSPSSQPSSVPSSWPTCIPTREPSSLPSSDPSTQPTSHPSGEPSAQPSSVPTATPTSAPSTQPSSEPSAFPSSQPSISPTVQPTMFPSTEPTGEPTAYPSNQPSTQPSGAPSNPPSTQPTGNPSQRPTAAPTSSPSSCPSSDPSAQPSSVPTVTPTSAPSTQPSSEPSAFPSSQPSISPTVQPTMFPSTEPTGEPTAYPSNQPSTQPSGAPSNPPTTQPTGNPSQRPTAAPTSSPSSCPSSDPSAQPTYRPSSSPSSTPTMLPSTIPSGDPSRKPSVCPTDQPIKLLSIVPTVVPTSMAIGTPTGQPSMKPITASPSLVIFSRIEAFGLDTTGQSETPKTLLRTLFGNLVVAGYSVRYDGSGYYGVLTLLDNCGQILRSLQVKGDSYYSRFSAATERRAGQLQAVGETTIADARVGFSAVFDEEANLTTTQGIQCSSNLRLYGVTKALDGGAVIVGTLGFSGDDLDVFVARMDSNNVLLWAKSFDSFKEDRATDVVELPGNYIVVIGEYNHEALFMLLDSDGEPIFTQTVPDASFNKVVYQNDEILIIGQLRSAGVALGLVVSATPSGEITRVVTVNGGSENSVVGISAISAHEYVITMNSRREGRYRNSFAIHFETVPILHLVHATALGGDSGITSSFGVIQTPRGDFAVAGYGHSAVTETGGDAYTSNFITIATTSLQFPAFAHSVDTTASVFLNDVTHSVTVHTAFTSHKVELCDPINIYATTSTVTYLVQEKHASGVSCEHRAPTPTRRPTLLPSVRTTTGEPTRTPTTRTPTKAGDTNPPTSPPTAHPSFFPLARPSLVPSGHPTDKPSVAPSRAESTHPTAAPTVESTQSPSYLSTKRPTAMASQLNDTPQTGTSKFNYTTVCIVIGIMFFFLICVMCRLIYLRKTRCDFEIRTQPLSSNDIAEVGDGLKVVFEIREILVEEPLIFIHARGRNGDSVLKRVLHTEHVKALLLIWERNDCLPVYICIGDERSIAKGILFSIGRSNAYAALKAMRPNTAVHSEVSSVNPERCTKDGKRLQWHDNVEAGNSSRQPEVVKPFPLGNGVGSSHRVAPTPSSDTAGTCLEYPQVQERLSTPPRDEFDKAWSEFLNSSLVDMSDSSGYDSRSSNTYAQPLALANTIDEWDYELSDDSEWSDKGVSEKGGGNSESF